MKLFLGAAVIIAAMLGSIGASSAAWLYQPKEDAFSDDVLHIVVGISPPYSAGFRCRAEDDLELMYFTPEKIDDGDLSGLDIFDTTLLVRVDSGEVQKIPASLELTDENRLSVVTDHELIYDVARDVAKAKRRVAFALEILSQRMHAKEFDVSGSTKAVDSLLSACSID